MSDETTKSTNRIRTFAQDLNDARQKRGDKKPQEKETEKPVEKKETPKMAAPKEMSPVVPPKPKVEQKTTAPISEPVKTVTPPKAPIIKPDLQKEIEKIKTETKKPKVKPLPKKEPATKNKPVQKNRPNIGYDATVITDTKHKRFRFFPALTNAIKKWFTAHKPKKKTIPPPTFTVPKATERKGVIQQATSKTGAAFTANNEDIKERIKQRRSEDAATKKEPVKDEEVIDDPETFWTPYTEPGYPLLEEEHVVPDSTQNVVVAFKKKAVPPVAEPTPELIPHPVVTEEELPTPEPEVLNTEDEIEIEDIQDGRWAGNNDDIDVKQALVENPTPTWSTTLPAATPTSEKENGEPEQETSDLSDDILGSQTNVLTIIILLIIIVGLVLFFAARIFIFDTSDNTQERTTEITTIATLTSDSKISPITLTSSVVNQVDSLISAEIEKHPVGLVEMPLVSLTGEEVSASYLFNLLDFETKAVLKQSISTARFVTYNQSDPVLILKFGDTNTVRGGLYNWEPTMMADITSVYSEQISTNANVSFSDKTIATIDTRLIEVDEQVILIYGFVDQNTVLITPNQALFETIAPQINK